MAPMASPMVGTFGNRGERCGCVTASPTSLPAAMCGSAGGAPTSANEVSPPTTPAVAGAAPL